MLAPTASNEPRESQVHQAVRSHVMRAETTLRDAEAAVRELAESLPNDQLAGVFLFCADHYEPAALAAAIARQFTCPVAGCTTAGEIGSRYQSDGIVALGFSAAGFRLHVRLLPAPDEFTPTQAREVIDSLRGALELSPDLAPEAMFGVVLLDGLSYREETVTSYLHSALMGVGLVGGSAGDSLAFRETRVYAQGAFHRGAGVLVLVESRLPFEIFRVQHFMPSELEMIITAADPVTRTVHEIDGAPAAEAYAGCLGMAASDLTPEVFSRHPVILEIGGEAFVRSIQRANPDGSLTFFCAIDEGLILSMARSSDCVENLTAEVARLGRSFPCIEATLGFDCILRRLELAATGRLEAAESALAPLRMAGFSTFGEQIDAVHVNQTLTGVVFGAMP